MPTLYAEGRDGAGQTIVIVDSYGSPTISRDLAKFDSATAGFDLPPPPSFKIITPAGAIPPYDPSDRDMVNWATETSLDVEWSHAMAPDANILLVETPTDETIGTAGFPEIVKAENYVINHGLGNVISQSFGAAEPTFPSASSIRHLRSAYVAASHVGVTVLASTGDQGASAAENAAGTEYFTTPVVQWPASDPLVTAVGGTQLHLNASGDRTAPDNVWNDTSLFGEPAAGGGGVSSVFSRPAYQSGVAAQVGTQRGIPDVSMSAAVNGAVLIYTSFAGQATGWEPIGGTSAATPMLAGIVAIADQVVGHGLGEINPTLYKVGSGSPGLPDITKGNNTVSFAQGGTTVTVHGYSAATGYDMASGLGTASGPALVTALTAPTVSAVTPTSGPVSGGTELTITGTNFVPGATAMVGPYACGSVTIVSSTTLTCTTGVGVAGTYDVRVTTASGTSANNGAAKYTYEAAPTVSDVPTTSVPSQ